MDYGHKLTEKELEELEKRISKEYETAEKEVQDKLFDYLQNFERKDADMQAQMEAGKITQTEYNNWRVNQMATGKRWEDMRNSLAEDFHNANNIAKEMTKEHSYDIYALNHNYGTFEIEKGLGIDTSYTLYDRATVERLVKDNPQMLPPPGKKVSERIKAGLDVRWNNQQIQSVMVQGLLQGMGIPELSKRLAETVGDKDKVGAIRNARTMTTGAQNAGRVDSYQRATDMGIEMKQMWIATLDDRTRHSHRKMDGEMVAVGETFSNGCRFPGDAQAEPEEVYNCRCTLVAKLPGIPYTFAERGTTREEYEEWKKDKEPAEKVQEEKTEEPEKVEEPVKAEEQIEEEKVERNTDFRIEDVVPSDVLQDLRDLEKKYVNAKTEHYTAIDRNGNVIFESGKGGKRGVSVPDYVDKAMEGGYSFHNHPADAVFSVADIVNYEKYGEHGFVVDMSGNEYILYNLNPVAKYEEVTQASRNYDDERYKELMPFSVAVGQEFSKIEDEIMQERREYGKELLQTEPDSTIRAQKMMEWMEEHNAEELKIQWLEENAEDYGFVFIHNNIYDKEQESQVEEPKVEKKEEEAVEFVPAKTKADAEEFAMQFAENVDYSKLSLEKANGINEQLFILTQKYPISKLEDIKPISGGGAVMNSNCKSLGYNKAKLGATLEKSYEAFLSSQEADREFIDFLTKRYEDKPRIPYDVQQKIDILTRNLNYTRWSVDDSYEDKIKVLVTHEYGHIIADQYFGQLNGTKANPNYDNMEVRAVGNRWDAIYKKAIEDGDIYKVSKYGASDSHEFFAECFAMREWGEEMPDYIDEFIQEVLDNGIM